MEHILTGWNRAYRPLVSQPMCSQLTAPLVLDDAVTVMVNSTVPGPAFGGLPLAVEVEKSSGERDTPSGVSARTRTQPAAFSLYGSQSALSAKQQVAVFVARLKAASWRASDAMGFRFTHGGEYITNGACETMTITGINGSLRWGYHEAASLSGWVITKSVEGAWSFTSTASTVNAVRVSQRPLSLVVRHAHGVWTWPVETLQMQGASLSGTLGPKEK
jgi:hypothetical protein